MPKLGESIIEAAIIKWFKNIGDTIEEDEILLEVATDKVDSEVPSLVSGVVTELLYKQNDVIKIGETIAIIKTDGKISIKQKKPKAQKKPSTPQKKPAPSFQRTKFSVPDSSLYFSPLVVSIAKEQHISFEELARIPVSGNDGRLRKADLTDMVQWRNKVKVDFQKKYKEKLTFTPLFVEAVAKSIVDFPMINSTLDGKNIIVKENINIGMATALPSGNLIVPVVKNADKKSLKELAVAINTLSLKAREGRLKADDTSGSTFTISNVGTFGSVMGTPIINQPEAAILATGIIKKRAEVMEREDGDSIEIRHMMYLSLSFDHRIVDGFLAGSFLKRIADTMEKFDVNRKI